MARDNRVIFFCLPRKRIASHKVIDIRQVHIPASRNGISESTRSNEPLSVYTILIETSMPFCLLRECIPASVGVHLKGSEQDQTIRKVATESIQATGQTFASPNFDCSRIRTLDKVNTMHAAILPPNLANGTKLWKTISYLQSYRILYKRSETRTWYGCMV